MTSNETTLLDGDSPSDIARMQKYFDHPSLDELAATLRSESDESLKRDAEICWALLEKHGKPPIELLGAGAFGVVFRVHDSKLKRDVAIKLLRPSVQQNAAAAARFRFEAHAAAKCNLEGVVPIFEFGEFDGRPFIVSQCITGTSLAKYLEINRGKIAERHAAAVAQAVALAVHGIHQRDYLHRDVKPANILLEQLDEPGSRELPFRPLIADFGLAKRLETDTKATSISEDSSIVGTLQYMSPEQAAGQSKLITVTTDVYAIGAILFEMLTGRPPFAGLTKLALLHNIVHQPAPSVRKVMPRISRELDAIVLKSLSKNPAERYGSAEALAMDLDCFLSGRPTIARPALPPRALILWANRNRAWAVGVATIWISTTVLLVGLGVLYGRERRAVQVANETAYLAVGMAKDYYARLAEELGKMPGTSQERLRLHQELRSQFQKLAEIRSFDSFSRHQLSIAYHFVASSESRLCLSEPSRKTRRKAVELLTELVRESPTNINYRFDLYYNAMLLGIDCDNEESDHFLNLAQQSIELVCKQIPDDPTYRDAQNALLCMMAFSSIENDIEQSKRLAFATIESTDELANKYPEKPLYGKYLYKSHQCLGRAAIAQHEWGIAKEHFLRSLEALKNITAYFPSHGERLEEELNLRLDLVKSLHHGRMFPLLIAETARCWPLMDGLSEWYEGDKERIRSRIQLKLWLAEALWNTGEPSEARKEFDEARIAMDDFPERTLLGEQIEADFRRMTVLVNSSN